MIRTLMTIAVMVICGVLAFSFWIDGTSDGIPAISDANNTTDYMSGAFGFDTVPPTYGSVFVETSTGKVDLDLLQLEYCTLEEIANFGCFMQIATNLHLLSNDEYPSSLNPKILDILVERLISPKLIKEKHDD